MYSTKAASCIIYYRTIYVIILLLQIVQSLYLVYGGLCYEKNLTESSRILMKRFHYFRKGETDLLFSLRVKQDSNQMESDVLF